MPRSGFKAEKNEVKALLRGKSTINRVGYEEEKNELQPFPLAEETITYFLLFFIESLGSELEGRFRMILRKRRSRWHSFN